MICPFCHSTALIGIELEEVYDGVIYWRCRSCGEQWHRFPQGDPRHTALVSARPDLVLRETPHGSSEPGKWMR